MDNDLYPNDGEYFSIQEPVDQQLRREATKGKTRAGKDVIIEVLARLESQIGFYRSLDSIPEETLDDPELFMHIVAGNKLAALNLTREQEYWRQRLSTTR